MRVGVPCESQAASRSLRRSVNPVVIWLQPGRQCVLQLPSAERGTPAAGSACCSCHLLRGAPLQQGVREGMLRESAVDAINSERRAACTSPSQCVVELADAALLHEAADQLGQVRPLHVALLLPAPIKLSQQPCLHSSSRCSETGDACKRSIEVHPRPDLLHICAVVRGWR